MTGSKKVNRGGLVWAALLLPLLLAACGATGVRHAHPVTVEPATAVVPDLEGLALADARRSSGTAISMPALSCGSIPARMPPLRPAGRSTSSWPRPARPTKLGCRT